LLGHQNDNKVLIHCGQSLESINNLLTSCVFAREFWFKLLERVGLQEFAPQPEVLSFED
jgi:hypothetical protein